MKDKEIRKPLLFSKKWLTTLVMSAAVLGSMISAEGVAAATHTMQPGDTLYSLAREAGVTVEEVVSWNEIEDVTDISVGTQLQLAEAAPVAQAAATPVQQSDAAVLEALDQESAQTKYEKAHQGTVTVPNADGSQRVVQTSPYQKLVSGAENLTPEMIGYYMQTVDVRYLNDLFGQYLNEDRLAQGKAPLTYMPDYQYGADIRANELASIGTLYVNGQKHVRLDGRHHDTAYDYLGEFKGKIGENLAGINYNGNPYELVSEHYLAEKAYISWLNSPGHKTNQEHERYSGYALSIVPVRDVAWSEALYDSGYIAVLTLIV